MVVEKLKKNMTLAETLSWGKAKLNTAKIQTCEREARWLLEFVIGNNKLVAEPDSLLTEKQRKKYEELILRRAERYPLQYLLGEVEFAGADIELTPDVLIPRPETELLVEHILEIIKEKKTPVKCADLGTGSGCIAIAAVLEIRNSKIENRNKSEIRNSKSKNILLTPFKGGLNQKSKIKEHPPNPLQRGTKFFWFVCDKSERALKLAKKNAKKNGVSDLVSFYLGNWFDAFPKDLKFDLIVTNPPYVRAEEKLEPELSYEPSTALFSGKDGLDDYRKIFASLRSRLLPGGIFIGEFSSEQEPELYKIAKQTGLADIEFLTDLTGRKRLIILKML